MYHEGKGVNAIARELDTNRKKVYLVTYLRPFVTGM